MTHHTKEVNALAVSAQGALLLTGGNDTCIALWSLVSGEMMQEINMPTAGYISAITWMDVDDCGETMFAFGSSDGNIQLYERLNDVLDMFTPVVSQPKKWPYIVCMVHFYDKGASLLVSYLESGDVLCYSIEPWDLKWQKKVQSRIGNTALDGNYLLMSNLKDGVDKYTIPTLQCVQSFTHVILDNIPLQISDAKQSGLIVVGGDDSFARIFDYISWAYRGQLLHGSQGDQITPVVSYEGCSVCVLVTASCLSGHSSVKVWSESEVVSPNIISVFAPNTLLMTVTDATSEYPLWKWVFHHFDRVDDNDQHLSTDWNCEKCGFQIGIHYK
ncbi:WD40 repeat-like protein [Suillus hirtellus]|nr:WD40 repeat-like protein [Suillus hirtellus]